MTASLQGMLCSRILFPMSVLHSPHELADFVLLFNIPLVVLFKFWYHFIGCFSSPHVYMLPAKEKLFLHMYVCVCTDPLCGTVLTVKYPLCYLSLAHAVLYAHLSSQLTTVGNMLPFDLFRSLHSSLPNWLYHLEGYNAILVRLSVNSNLP